MAKRFIDTDIFKKGFMKSLEASYKLLWIYILGDCNHAGIYEVEMDIASLRIGCVVEEEIALKYFKGKVIPFDSGTKWFIPGFIEFQYGELSEKNKAHSGVIRLLEKYNLIENIKALCKPLESSLQGAKDKDKDKEMDMDKGGIRGKKFILSEVQVSELQTLLEAKAMSLSKAGKPITYNQVLSAWVEFVEVNKDADFEGINHAKRMFSNWIDKKHKSNENPRNATANFGKSQTGSRNLL